MRVAITGADGFVGTHLKRFFSQQGIAVVPLVKSDFLVDKMAVIKSKLQGCDVVINLGGASIAKRWNPEYKQLIYSSRINTTKLLVSAINSMENKPKLLFSTSAVGIYPSGRTYTEDDLITGTDFLAKVCVDWEHEAKQVSSSVRLVITRFGVVLADDGGAFPKMLLPFKMGLAGKIGSGSESFSWIHIDDLQQAIHYIIQHEDLHGVFNFTTPDVVTNLQWTKQIAKDMHVACCVSVPRFVFRVALGEGYTVFVGGKSAFPKRLIEAGYKFKFPEMKEALDDLLKKENSASTSTESTKSGHIKERIILIKERKTSE